MDVIEMTLYTSDNYIIYFPSFCLQIPQWASSRYDTMQAGCDNCAIWIFVDELQVEVSNSEAYIAGKDDKIQWKHLCPACATGIRFNMPRWLFVP